MQRASYDRVAPNAEAAADQDGSKADTETVALTPPQNNNSSSSATSTASASSSSNDTTMSMDEAIEALGMGTFQYRMMAVLGLFFAADAMQVMLLSFLVIVLQQDWQIESMAVTASAVFIGALAGTMVLGPLADTRGRRPVFLWAAAIVAFAGIGAACASSVKQLTVMIFLVGFGVGGLTIPFDILAEFSPAEGRGGNLLFIEYFWTLGALYVVLVAYATLHKGGDHWRYFIALCTLPCFISLVVGYLYVPESARWLSSQGRLDEAMLILRAAAKQNGLSVDEVFPLELQLEPEPHHAEASIMDLLQPRWRKTVLSLWGVWLLFSFGYYGTIMTITDVFEDDKKDSGDSNDARYNFNYSAIFIASAAEFIGTTVAILIVDRVGRIPCQAVSYASGGVCVFFLCTLSTVESTPAFVLLGLSFVARSLEMCATCVTWVSTAEILPTELRGTGHATSNAIARIGAMACPFLLDGKQSLSSSTIGWIMLATHTATVCFVVMLPETKGRNLGRENEMEQIPSEATDGEEGEFI